MPLDIAFPLKRANPPTLAASQTLALESEDGLLIIGKWKKEVQIPNYQASTSSSNDALVQKLVNDVIVVEKQLPKASFPYQDIPRKYPNHNVTSQGKQFTLPPSQKILQIEPPPNKNNMCVFHLTNDHEGTTCPEDIRHQQLETERAITANVVIEEAPSKGPGDSVNCYLEYEFDSDRGSDFLITLEEASCSILTRGQRMGKLIFSPKML